MLHLPRGLVAVFAVAVALSLSGCAWIDRQTGKEEKRDADYQERPIHQIYEAGWKKLRNGDYDDAAKQFAEVERQHPYSVWARRASLMSAYCYYQANKYTEAVSASDNYISLHPGSKEVAYAFYLKAISLYEQIVDVERDQSNTEAALVALQDVVQRFPETEYARDATLKIDLTMDHLAGKQMEIGRYYLFKGNYIGAINRFRVVVEQYQKTTQIAEALERLTEAYYALGIVKEAQTAAAVLGHNYPGSKWYENAYGILQKKDLKPVEDKESWISRAFSSVL